MNLLKELLIPNPTDVTDAERVTDMHDQQSIGVSQPYGPGIELSCRYVFDHVNQMLPKNKFVEHVRIWEHPRNSAIYTRDMATNLIADKRF